MGVFREGLTPLLPRQAGSASGVSVQRGDKRRKVAYHFLCVTQTTKECYASSGVSSVTLFYEENPQRAALSPRGKSERAVNHLGSLVFWSDGPATANVTL